MKRKIFIFYLIFSILFLNSYVVLANDNGGIVYKINIYINDKYEDQKTQILYESYDTPNSYDFGEFEKNKSNAKVNNKTALLMYHSSNFEVFDKTTWQYPVAGDDIVVNLYYKVEEEPESEPTYGTVTLNISDGKNPIEGYSVTFNGHKGPKDTTVVGTSDNNGQVIVQLDESYEWEYSVDGSTWNVQFENNSYRNDISLQKELDEKEIEYDGQNYNVNTTLQFNEKAGGTLVDGLTDSEDVIKKDIVKKSGTAITYQEITEDLEKQDNLVIHNNKLYRSSSVYVSAKDSVYSPNTLVNHGEYIVTNSNTTITIQFIYVKDIEPIDEGAPVSGDKPPAASEKISEEPKDVSTPPKEKIISKTVVKTVPSETIKKEQKTIRIKETPIQIIQYYITENYKRYNTIPSKEEKEEVSEEMQENKVPLGINKKTKGYWALVNLIATIITIILSFFMVIFGFLNKEKEDEETKVHNRGFIRLISVIVAVMSTIVFILTEDMLLPMKLVDKWTLIMIFILIIQIVVAFLCKHRKEKEEDF